MKLSNIVYTPDLGWWFASWSAKGLPENQTHRRNHKAPDSIKNRTEEEVI